MFEDHWCKLSPWVLKQEDFSGLIAPKGEKALAELKH